MFMGCLLNADKGYISTYALLIVAAVITICAWHHGIFSRRNIPPGPWGFPIVGNLPMLGAQPHATFMHMRKKYGDVFSFRIGSFPAIVINGNEAIREALLTNSGCFDDRPGFLSFTIAPLSLVSFAPFNQRWIVFKKVVKETLHKIMKDKNTCTSLDELLRDECVCLINDILAHEGRPFNPKDDLYVSSCSAAYQLCYGKGEDIRADTDLKKLLATQVAISTIANPVESIPWLKYIMPWKAKPFHELNNLYLRIKNKKIMEHRNTFINGEVRDMTDAFLNFDVDTLTIKNVGIKREHLLGSLAEIIPAAFDTTATAMLWICLLMITHPDIQRNVQDEIDREVGNRRLSVKSDRGKLPNTEAVIVESMRLKPPIPTSLPHAAYRDTTFRGYDIRKGTVVILNLHSAMRDPELFEEPDEFQPKRFLNTDGTFNTEKAKLVIPFGLGIRKCIGETLARNQLFMIFATLMQHFSLCKVNGEDYDMVGVNTLTDCPKPYRLVAHVR